MSSFCAVGCHAVAVFTVLFHYKVRRRKLRSLISVPLVSRWDMNLFLPLWALPCLEEESYTCLDSSPTVSEVASMSVSNSLDTAADRK